MVMTSRAEQIGSLRVISISWPGACDTGRICSMLLKMAEECERLADQQEELTDLRSERSYGR